jgi:hypothetical protein
MKKVKRDIQGKFTLKNDDYREVRSLRLTDDTWKRLGIVSECLGLTRADYLEEIIQQQSYPCNTRANQGIIQSRIPHFKLKYKKITSREKQKNQDNEDS